MRLYLRSGLAALVAMAAFAATASAGISPDSNPLAAIDGTDIYGYTEYTGRFGDPTDSVLWRKSILTGKRVTLAEFKTMKNRIQVVKAGGGRVAVMLGAEPNINRFKVKILAMNRDGSGRRVIASSSLNWYDDGKAGAVQCGSVVNLINASPTGSFVIATTRETSSSAKCGRKSSLLRWSYDELLASGGRREIYSSDVKPAPRGYLSPLASVEVNGDFAAIVKRKNLKVYVKNLETGVQTGPFIDSVRLAQKKLRFNRISLGPNGMLALESDVLDQSAGDSSFWMDVFSNPLLPAVATRSTARFAAQFCGDHLIDISWDGVDPKTNEYINTVREFDPLTLQPIRTLASITEYEDIEACSPGFVVIRRSVRGKEKFRAVPIPPL